MYVYGCGRSVANKIKAAQTGKPGDEPEIVCGRIEGTKNDVAHPRVFAGQYPIMCVCLECLGVSSDDHRIFTVLPNGV
jgi:hypothetical protein